MEPVVLVDGEYSAPLDGMTLGGKLMVEIKSQCKGRASALWAEVSEGQVPEHHRWQVQHQHVPFNVIARLAKANGLLSRSRENTHGLQNVGCLDCSGDSFRQLQRTAIGRKWPVSDLRATVA